METDLELELAAHERHIAETFARRRFAAWRWWRGIRSWIAR
ncbi:MAG: hypothetical protein U0869_15445 [Chloroflexota bacterium]